MIEENSLVQRLRDPPHNHSDGNIRREAADRIEHLQEVNYRLRVRWDHCTRRVEELKQALRTIAELVDEVADSISIGAKAVDIARCALEPEP